MNAAVRLLACLALSAIALPSLAQFAKPEEAVEYRQSAFTLMANHMKRIKAQLDQGVANMEAIRASTRVVDALKALPFEAFIPGSGDVADSAAKPEIWSDNERFKKLASEMQDKVAKLNAAAQAGDPLGVRSAFGETGKACKTCHDDFRKKR